MSTSRGFRFNKTDLVKVGKGLLIAFAGALATYLQDTIPQIDFGQYQLVAVAVNSTLVNFIYKWIRNNE